MDSVLLETGAGGEDTAVTPGCEQVEDAAVVPLDHPTIQDAVDAGEPTICVLNGRYTENVVIRHDVVLVGQSRDGVVIDGGAQGPVVDIADASVTLMGFTLENAFIASNGDDGALRAIGDSTFAGFENRLVLSDLLLQHNHVDASVLQVVAFDEVVAQRVEVQSNTAERGFTGIALHGDVVMVDTVRVADGPGGLDVWRLTDAVVRNVLVEDIQGDQLFVLRLGGHGAGQLSHAQLRRVEGTCLSSGLELYGDSVDVEWVDVRDVTCIGRSVIRSLADGLAVENLVAAGNRIEGDDRAMIVDVAGQSTWTNATFRANSVHHDVAASGWESDGATHLVNLDWSGNVVDAPTTYTASGFAGAGLTFSHCNLSDLGDTPFDDVADPRGADGNIDVSPGFTDVSPSDPTQWDLTLGAGSPLIDAGDPAILDADGSTSDIGAYGGPGGDGW